MTKGSQRGRNILYPKTHQHGQTFAGRQTPNDVCPGSQGSRWGCYLSANGMNETGFALLFLQVGLSSPYSSFSLETFTSIYLSLSLSISLPPSLSPDMNWRPQCSSIDVRVDHLVAALFQLMLLVFRCRNLGVSFPEGESVQRCSRYRYIRGRFLAGIESEFWWDQPRQMFFVTRMRKNAF